jgi:hypothetical protein
MEVIKRKILLEESTYRNYGSTNWGVVTATTFYLNIQLNQTMDDMGLFTDIEYIQKPKRNTGTSLVDYSILIEKLEQEGFSFPFMVGGVPLDSNSTQFMNLLTPTDKAVLRLTNKTLSQYYYYGNNPLTGSTDSKIDDVRSYKRDVPYIAGFNINEETYLNYANIQINGVNRVTNIGEPKVYVFDAIDDLTIGMLNQTTGIQYKDFSASTINGNLVPTGIDLPTTTFRFISEGWNQTNTSLSALVKEEFLFGIISRPEVENDVFIDRGVVPVLDYHLRLSEIKNLGQLQQYGNGYYRIDRI